jgi:DNA polymerase IV
MGMRKIIHVDLDAFFCSVEEIFDLSLKGKSFVVGGPVGTRSVVATSSYAARQKGIHSAMPIDRAVKLDPDLIIVNGRHGVYGEYSDKVMDILNRFSGMIEQVSIDEAFLDVSDMPESGEVIARKIQAAIQNETGLPSSLGVASNKLVAKIANNVGKTKNRGSVAPRAITVIPPGEEAAFLAPLPTRELWGVGPKTAAVLEELGIFTIGEIAKRSESSLKNRFGKYGNDLSFRARGIDYSPVSNEHETKSVSNETTFEQDITDEKKLLDTIQALSSQVAFRLRKHDFCATTIRIKLRWSDFSTITRQFSLRQPTDQDGVIFSAAKGLFLEAWQDRRPVRLIGVGSSGLTNRVHQLSLWETPTEKERRLLEAIDEIRARFGKQLLTRGLKARELEENKKKNISRTDFAKPRNKD